MKITLRRGILAGLLLLVGSSTLLTSGCLSAPGQHWNVDSLVPGVGYHFFGYREDLDGSYRELQWQNKKDINLTLRRHFLNNNPENPFQAEDPSLSAPRPHHSILPDPVYYFHLESIVVGLAIDAATGVFVPIPIGSVIASIEEGGAAEFTQGMSNTLTGSFGHTLGSPPSLEDFRVRNTARTR